MRSSQDSQKSTLAPLRPHTHRAGAYLPPETIEALREQRDPVAIALAMTEAERELPLHRPPPTHGPAQPLSAPQPAHRPWVTHHRRVRLQNPAQLQGVCNHGETHGIPAA